MERAFECRKTTPTVCFCCTCLLILRAIPKCLKHPAGPGQKLIHGRDIELQKNYCNFSEYSSYNKNLCSLWPNTEACAVEALNTLLVCFLHLAGAVLPNIPSLQRIKQLILRTIRQQICTNKQICTFESFGQKHQNFRRYGFIPRYRNVRAWFTKPVVLCAAIGGMVGRIAPAECRQHTNHVVVLQSHKFLYSGKGNTDLGYRSCTW